MHGVDYAEVSVALPIDNYTTLAIVIEGKEAMK